ncbi:MAG: patatin-like phospholipase family protein [Gammaproteobacteria bacterium]
MTTIRNIVIGGGGIAGAHAYPAAIKELRKKIPFEHIIRICGVSIGAITALLLALNFTDDEIDRYMASINFSALKDSAYFPTTIYSDATTRYGAYKGEVLFGIIKGILKAKNLNENITFGELKKLNFKDIYVTVTHAYFCNDVEKSDVIYFSHQNAYDTPIAAVILASASASPYFPRVRLEEQAKGKFIKVDDSKGHVYTDGGWKNNFPIKIFDDSKYRIQTTDQVEAKEIAETVNPETLGIALVHSSEIKESTQQCRIIKSIPDGNPASFFYALLEGGPTSKQSKTLQKKQHRDRSILIDRLGIALADFDIPPATQLKLRESGAKAACEYLKALFPEPVNQPMVVAVSVEPLAEIPKSVGEGFAKTEVAVSSLWVKPNGNEVVAKKVDGTNSPVIDAKVIPDTKPVASWCVVM